MRSLPDLFELRMDHMPRLLEGQIRKLRRPIVLTARHPAEGGRKLPINRSDLLLRLLPLATFVDVELRSLHELRAVWKRARQLKIGRICSFHDFRRTPSLAFLQKQSGRARKAGADIFKLVTRADSLRDCVVLHSFIQKTSPGTRLCVMAVGKHGELLRVFFSTCGFVYAPLCRPLYKGQLRYEELRRLIDFYAKK